MADIEDIFPADRPRPAGHYSPATAWGDLVFVSGQLPVTADGGHALAEADFATQTRAALANLFAVLAAAESGPERIVKTTIFLTDIADWPECNRIYAELLGDHRPARSIVPCGPLHFGFRIEIEAIAIRR